MVCIAAFIVLVFLALSLPVLRLFNKSAADNVWKNLKLAWSCVGRRLTFRACDTTFKQDIEHSILRRVIRKSPKLVKPTMIAVEVASILIVVITIWSILVVVKSGLALYVYGTCDVSKPSACSLSQTEACSIDSVNPSGFIVGWFAEWGDLFTALPARFKSWDASDYIPKNGISYAESADRTAVDDLPVAISIIDPGCIVCKQSFEAQLASGFTEKYRVYVIPYSIKTETGYQFKNSRLVAQYIEAVRGYGDDINEWVIIKKLFTEKMPDSFMDYQQAFNMKLSAEEAETELVGWLRAAGADDDDINQITNRAHSLAIADALDNNHKVVDETIKTKYIPTMIYDGRRHEGSYRAN